MFTWLKERRRRKILASPFPDAWLGHLDAVGHYHLLPELLRPRLRDCVQIFIAEKTWEGCKGLVLTDEMKVTIAALACLLIVGMDDFIFDNVQTLLIYPEEYVAKQQVGVTDQVYLEAKAARLGEAHYRGPVILSWNEVVINAHEPGFGTNLVFHEFAHQLDMLNGEADGVPLLAAELDKRWQKIMAPEFARLERRADRGRESLIDPYGAESPAEFFAVITEAFFDIPRAFKDEHARLYNLLSEYYRLDPATWEVSP